MKKMGKRKIISIVIVLSVIIILACVYLYAKFKLKLGDGNSNLEIVYYASQIISSIFVIAGVVIAVWQYFITARSQLNQLSVDRIQKAIDLSEYYKDNILHKSTPIRFVYEQSGIIDLIKNVDKDKMIRFEESEAGILLEKDKYDKLKAKTKTKEFSNAVLAADYIYGLKISKDIIISGDNQDGNDEDIKMAVELKGEMAAKAFMIDEVSGVLNNIEYFAMNFAHGVADDSVVYRSLHQSYIDIMQLLYFNISNLNNSSSDKYYLNAIELYNKWKSQKDRDINEKNIIDMTREAKNKGTIVNMEKI